MSDGFDKEAEREKLREKLADDEQKREHTQRMSELLLKGATMTNRHCDNCGDPIFRHDGREFCPSCGNEVGGATGANADENSAGAADSPATDADSPATDADSPPVANATPEGGVDAGTADPDPGAVPPDAGAVAPHAGTAETDAASADTSVDSGAPENGRSPASSPAAAPSGQPEPRRAEPRRSSPDERSEPDRSAPRQAEPSPSASPRSAADAGGVDAARASLTRTLTRFARAAEETDDPRRARDHLEAAREAAEALAALD
ncbi:MULTISPECIES: Sjogren's syndrome/scleroderma autoantigen 1 family protein [Halorubrum]|uniref:Sjogrens syndrome scleroderma autoantigen 1 n=1 Tax=Halorubrum hochstenium ATCC 700873 TaxID=1227481 RepID=M0F524_9EURY|nr:MULTISPECIES: Sjogren's syndrome/scleroderma autoantigen 1 family protein [Halorubrum]ELZ55005.1 hypothetical protein C467_09776 [Halorubrum hochstenium ATCC 700873]